MKQSTIKWRIFKYNLIAIAMMIILVFITFNVMVRVYFEQEIFQQLTTIASHTENTALQDGPRFFLSPDSNKSGSIHPLPPPLNNMPQPDRQFSNDTSAKTPPFPFYDMLKNSLNELLSVLNAKYILLNQDMNLISQVDIPIRSDILSTIKCQIEKNTGSKKETKLKFRSGNTDYIAIIKPVSQKNTYDLGWIIIYSRTAKIEQLQLQLNLILLIILLLAAGIVLFLSSYSAKKISAPISSLNQYIRSIAERNFKTKISLPAVDEISELAKNINLMSEKLEGYDKAQKTFLQNASHELRTPLMSILSYAEGIKYGVVDPNTASDVIINESNRLTHLVEDLLYLSHLDTIQENYHFELLELHELINTCIARLNGLTINSNIEITSTVLETELKIRADEEKLSRAILNILSNCLRYAGSAIKITVEKISAHQVKLMIEDDGPGIDNQDLANIFTRFYKGKGGKFGLGLAISKNIIEKHNGQISVANSNSGAAFKIILPLSL